LQKTLKASKRGGADSSSSSDTDSELSEDDSCHGAPQRHWSRPETCRLIDALWGVEAPYFEVWKKNNGRAYKKVFSTHR
jgi:hypothetical protein